MCAAVVKYRKIVNTVPLVRWYRAVETRVPCCACGLGGVFGVPGCAYGFIAYRNSYR